MPEPYIVVAGSPRSGTTLLRTLLKGSHALVIHPQEPHYILEMHRRFGPTITDVPSATEFILGHSKFPASLVNPDRFREALKTKSSVSLSEFLRISYRILRGDRPDAPLVLKHPAFMLHLDLVRELFPDLRVIHIVRDPRANAFSQRTRWPSTSYWMSATGWQSYIDAGVGIKRRGHIPYLELRYEDLLKEPEAYCRRVCDFIDIPFEPGMLAFDHVQKDWNPTNPGEGAKRHYHGFEQDRIDKWRKYMKPVEVKLIENQCRRGMTLLGYQTTDPHVSAREYVPFYLRERRRALQKSYRRLRRRWRER